MVTFLAIKFRGFEQVSIFKSVVFVEYYLNPFVCDFDSVRRLSFGTTDKKLGMVGFEGETTLH